MQKHFTGALGADDFMLRLEKALFAFGFAGDNSIGERSFSQLRLLSRKGDHGTSSIPSSIAGKPWHHAQIPPAILLCSHGELVPR